ncbi:MAG: hypothetical protein F4Y37_14435 [Caldilineaceae bacterium SB0664_bin_22]|nr:hypothetical protein [Caldilineaceae bacterium SB0664_bin_22]MYC63545.1 hypothetical protein [Caldilineaceae bacterium SB0661_bin_34]
MMTSRTVDARLPNPNGDTMRKETARRLLAEFLGTFLLIFAGTGAVVLADLGIGSLVSIMFAHALVIMVMAYAHGDISGSIINPAATLGLFVAGAIERVRVLPFIVVQLAGGVAGGLFVQFAFKGMVDLSGATSAYGATVIADGVSVPAAFALEVLGTFLMVNAILHCAVKGKAGNLAPIAIAFTVGALIVAFGPLTGASFNPARTLGPAVATGNYAGIWLYMVATFGGAALAGLYNRFFMLSNKGNGNRAHWPSDGEPEGCRSRRSGRRHRGRHPLQNGAPPS